MDYGSMREVCLYNNLLPVSYTSSDLGGAHAQTHNLHEYRQPDRYSDQKYFSKKDFYKIKTTVGTLNFSADS